MALSVDQSMAVLPLDDNVLNKAAQSDAARVHHGMNSQFRFLDDEAQLDAFFHDGFLMLAFYTSNEAVQMEDDSSEGPLRFYDLMKTQMIDGWTKGRGALVMTLEEASRAVKYSFPLKESMYMGGNPNGAKRGYRGFEERPKWNGVHDTESYISSAIRMQILAAWDESFRQGSAEFYDRQFADALAVWNQNRATEFPAQPTTPVAGEALGNATMAQNGGVSGDGL